MKKNRIAQVIPLLCLVISVFFVGSFTDSWAARLLSQEELHKIQGGNGNPDPSAFATVGENLTTAVVLKRQQVSFDGSESEGSGTLSYQWYFGDGGYSTQASPTHRYSTPGTYTVTLYVSNYYGEDSDTVQVKVYVPHVVKVGFSSDYPLKKEVNTQHVTISDPVWDMMVVSPYSSLDSGDTNDPVAYKKNSKPTLYKVQLWVGDSPTTTQNLTQSASINLDAVGTGSLDFNPASGSVQNWPSSEFTLSASSGSDDKFYNYIHKYNPFTLQWKYQISGDTQTVAMNNNTSHTLYLLYDYPKPPWNTSGSGPWVEVVDSACIWAEGESSPHPALSDVTTQLYNLDDQDGDIDYDMPGGAPHYSSSYWTFNLTQFLVDIDTSTNVKANCSDMANLVDIYGSALGIAVYQRRTDATGSGTFYTNNIDPIGSPSWDNFGWGFHQYGFYASKVYDACNKVDQSAPKYPVNMSVSTYDNHLIDQGSYNAVTGDASVQ